MNELEKIKERASCSTCYELFGIECNYGWYGLILPIIHAIEKYNDEQRKDNPEWVDITPTQIKEKWGTLNIYAFVPEHIMDMIEKAEESSQYICEDCGTPMNVGKVNKSWIRTLCRTCAGENPETERGWKVNRETIVGI